MHEITEPAARRKLKEGDRVIFQVIENGKTVSKEGIVIHRPYIQVSLTEEYSEEQICSYKHIS